MAKKSKKKKALPLSRARVMKAAIKFADKNGLDKLSMRKLAESLGVEAMSLYNHVRNKDDVYFGIVELVVGKIELPKADDSWKEAMKKRAISAHEVLVRHPWAAQLIVSRANVGPIALAYVDATIGCLVAAGFSYELADRAWNSIDSHIYGFTLQELNFPFEPSEYAASAQEHLALIPKEQYPHLHEMSQQVISGAYDGVHDFEFGLDLILDGLERMLDH